MKVLIIKESPRIENITSVVAKELFGGIYE